MNVVECKRRILLLLNTGMLFVSFSHHCQEMPYLMLKHLGIYDCGKHVLFFKFMCCVPLPMLSFVCELAMVVAHLASSIPCILEIFRSLILFPNHMLE